MAENTEHYNLVKPDYTDAADIGQLNGNMDTIDGILWQLANAGADEELLKKVQEILDKIGDTDDSGGSTALGSVMAKLNEIIQNSKNAEADILDILAVISSGIFESEIPGTYTVKISPITTQIKVTACGAGGGGGGGGANSASTYNGAGGGGGEAIVDKIYTVPKGEPLTVIIGKGGTNTSYTQNATDGEATIIQGVVTLAGGKGGKSGSSTSVIYQGGSSGGTGGGNGGNSGQNGESGITGAGGLMLRGAGGGGGSIGNGGNATASNYMGENTDGTGYRGGGGGGAAYRNGGKGGDGYVRIIW